MYKRQTPLLGLRVELLSKIGDFFDFTRKSCLGGCLVKKFFDTDYILWGMILPYFAYILQTQICMHLEVHRYNQMHGYLSGFEQPDA